ncbi:(2Fe-2S) ferredoxin domain-containing protein [Lyngbya confervoides]|uniref:(2Fe-2S) ferredoxin domain-containing protein n=1 Tax=Lyngbya confervoides BDU141951 TaxID=1574623 RepID=A0ABD4T148_9CYAN|nr:(2Fe-2S) ferredoxin domain-containing protein [Lyngbya confervoides]MCM1982353.1 (2Fe-2S) ferredoxin domain-containing protein [Lyngbya confervoides BDU141951]
MGASSKKVSVCCSGYIVDFRCRKNGEHRGMVLEASGSRLVAKFAKSLPDSSWMGLQRGDRVVIRGLQKVGGSKIKVTQIQPWSGVETVQLEAEEAPPELVGPTRPHSPIPIRVAVCHKSNCCRKGAREVAEALRSAVTQNDWDHQVSIQPAKCLGRCKAGPVVMVLPGKKRYSSVKPRQVERLLLEQIQIP